MVNPIAKSIYAGKKCTCLTYIRFLLNSELGPYLYNEEKIQTWRTAKNWTIEHTLGYELDAHVERYRQNKVALRSIYSLISALAILVSKEFDACLAGILENNWENFDKLFVKKQQECIQENLNWEEHRLVISEDICRTLYDNHISGWSYINEPPVQELINTEKRQYINESVDLYKNSLPEDVYSKRKKYHTAYHRIHLSIDLFSPIEDITILVKEIYNRKLEEHLDSIREHWVSLGETDKELIEEKVEDERSTFDHKRYSKQEKRSQSTIDHRIRALRYYYYDSTIQSHPKEEKVFKALEQKGWWKIAKTHGNKTKHMKFAKEMISAALKGNPVQQVPGVY